MDNLNTHHPASLYEAFGRRRRGASRSGWRFTIRPSTAAEHAEYWGCWPANQIQTRGFCGGKQARGSSSAITQYEAIASIHCIHSDKRLPRSYFLDGELPPMIR